jgi:hypothetical protein
MNSGAFALLLPLDVRFMYINFRSSLKLDNIGGVDER